jgi:hypothetical protein
VQSELLERAVDAVRVGTGIPVHLRDDGDPGATAGRTDRRWVRSAWFAILNVERWTRNRDAYLTVLEFNQESLRSFHSVLGEARWSGIVVSDVGSQHCYTVLVWIP